MAAVVVLVGAACDDGDLESSPTTASVTQAPTTAGPETTDLPPPTSEAPATTEAAPTTATPTTQPEPPTSPLPTTIDEEALKAEIAADFLASDARLVAMVENPSLDDLERRALEVAAPPLNDQLIRRVQDLVAQGDRVAPGDPPIHFVDVESVSWDSSSPTEAVLMVCDADNSRQITPGAGPNGEDVGTAGTGQLTARRFEQHVVLTENGWLPDVFQTDAIGVWQGVESCPPP